MLYSQVALIVHGLIDATLWGTRPAVLTWALWGLAMAAWNRSLADPALLPAQDLSSA